MYPLHLSENGGPKLDYKIACSRTATSLTKNKSVNSPTLEKIEETQQIYKGGELYAVSSCPKKTLNH